MPSASPNRARLGNDRSVTGAHSFVAQMVICDEIRQFRNRQAAIIVRIWASAFVNLNAPTELIDLHHRRHWKIARHRFASGERNSYGDRRME
jgi:hypothetical protein